MAVDWKGSNHAYPLYTGMRCKIRHFDRSSTFEKRSFRSELLVCPLDPCYPLSIHFDEGEKLSQTILFTFLVFSTAALAVPQNPATVFTEKISPQSISNILTYPARVESKVKAIVRAESDGVVTTILKPLGSKVLRGEVIAIVKHTDPVYQYAPLRVVAAIGGVVNEVHVTPGALVNKGDQVVTVTDPNQLRVI